MPHFERVSEGEALEQGQTVPESIAVDTHSGSDRRELLKKVGKFGLYTAPALLILLGSQQNAMAGS